MRHCFKYKGLSRTIKQRKALLRNMVDQLVVHERIQTTLTKALELRRHAEKVVQMAKRGKRLDIYRLRKMFRTEYACNKVLEVLAPTYQ